MRVYYLFPILEKHKIFFSFGDTYSFLEIRHTYFLPECKSKISAAFIKESVGNAYFVPLQISGLQRRVGSLSNGHMYLLQNILENNMETHRIFKLKGNWQNYLVQHRKNTLVTNYVTVKTAYKEFAVK